MNCCSCVHARQAGNQDLVGCCYWTAIFRGNRMALRSALAYINQEEDYHIHLDNVVTEKEAIGFLIDILIEDYAPKPLYQGWANLDLPYHQTSMRGTMSDDCVVLNPHGCCRFHQHQEQRQPSFQEQRDAALVR